MMINRRISAIFSHFNQVESPYIEPGLLVVFRLAVVLPYLRRWRAQPA